MVNLYQLAVTPTADTPGVCLIVSFGNGDRYLFGQVAEGTQRALTHRRAPMSRINNMFITGPIDWHSTGGLLGMMLTVADIFKEIVAQGAEQNRKRIEKGIKPLDNTIRPLNVYGGKNLTHMIASARNFIFRNGVPINAHEIVNDATKPSRESSEPDFQDENIRVWNVPLTPRSEPGRPATEQSEQEAFDQRLRKEVVNGMFRSNWSLDALREINLRDVQLPAKIFVRDGNGRIQRYNGPLPGRDEDCPDIKVLVRDPWPSALVTKLPPTKPSRDSMCYVVKNHPRRGKFNPSIPISLGVKKSDFSKLTRGESVTGSNGVVVTPEMVLDPTIPGSGVAIVEIRTEDLVESFLERPEWSNAEIMENIEAVYWILGKEVRNEARLISWMKERPQIRHYLISPGTSPNRIALEDPAAQLIKMHLIDPDRFPIPNHSNNEEALPPFLADTVKIPPLNATLQLVPKVREWEDGAIPPMNTRAPIDEIVQDKEIMDLVAAAREKITRPDFIAKVEASERGKPTDGVEVISLGTGSALPSKYRNVSATLVRVPGYGSYLLDCGENTLGQLRRVYGYEGADRILEDLHAICISHMHADHHLGTASVLARRAQLIEANPEIPPVALIACESFFYWFSDYNTAEDLGGAAHVETVQFSFSNKMKPTHKLASMGQTALPHIELVPVDHCRDATAVVLTWPSGLKIAYSGDCRPSSDFARVGRGAHLLIHEATFDSELTGEALAKKHSTVAEALEVGRQMEAEKILLTHFSQRYPKLPIVEETGQVVLCAFDLMRVKLKEFQYAQAFLPALRLLLAEGDDANPAAVEEEADLGPAKKKAKNGDEPPPPTSKAAMKRARKKAREEELKKAEEEQNKADEERRKAEQERTEERKTAEEEEAAIGKGPAERKAL